MPTKKSHLTLVGSKSTGMQPPRKLGKIGLALWQRVHRDFNVFDAGGVETLTQICLALDRLEEISNCIARDGLMVRTKSGLRSNPLICEEVALRSFCVRSLDRLGVSTES
jgi:hypothetical protein